MDAATVQLILLYAWLAGALYFVLLLGRITRNLISAVVTFSETLGTNMKYTHENRFVILSRNRVPWHGTESVIGNGTQQLQGILAQLQHLENPLLADDD